MATSVIEEERLRHRREGKPAGGDVVVYWMQQAQRAHANDALEYAIQRANELDLPLAVVFCVTSAYPDASSRHYAFMLQGLKEVESALHRRSIAFTAFAADAPTVLAALDHRLALLVTDRGYLPVQETWRREVENAISCPVVEVETDVVVPIDVASDHLEIGARTLRPKIMEQIDRFVVERSTTALRNKSAGESGPSVALGRTGGAPATVDLSDPLAAVRRLEIDDHPGPVEVWTGGTAGARARLRRFCDDVLPDYSERRRRFDRDHSSAKLSPFLHFGQISPVEIVREARSSAAPEAEIDAFVEEVVVRRELAINFVVNEPKHDTFAGLPDWARSTLDAHRDDERPARFTAAELESGETDDIVWNTIMKVIRNEGWVHNQLRMYWGKQLLRWTNTPEHAHRTLLDLNNRYFLDGRDPNSFANVAWCFGRHDQGFQERDVIGKIRPFTDQALRRKGDLDAWVEAHR